MIIITFSVFSEFKDAESDDTNLSSAKFHVESLLGTCTEAIMVGPRFSYRFSGTQPTTLESWFLNSKKVSSIGW
jgi:hypothetical protein